MDNPKTRVDPKVGSPHTVADCRLIELPKIQDTRGNLTFIEGNKHLSFDIKRVYYLYDVPSGAERGGHAHKKLRQFIISASGSFDVVVDDGGQRKSFHLNRPHFGLYIPTMIWRELTNFSGGSVSLVLASEIFEEEDYIREYDQFKSMVKKLKR